MLAGIKNIADMFADVGAQFIAPAVASKARVERNEVRPYQDTAWASCQ